MTSEEVLGGVDLHYGLYMKNPANFDRGLLIGLFTSVYNKEFISLSKTQEINLDPFHEPKEQRFQFVKNFLDVSILDIKKNSRASTFSRGLNKENEDVNLKILNGFLKRMKELENSPILGIFNLNLAILRKIGEISLQNSINDLSLEINKFYSLSSDDQEQRELLREKQKKNFFKESINLSLEEKKIYSLLELIENLKIPKSIPKNEFIANINDFE